MLGLGKDSRSAEPLVVPRAEHNISRKNMEEEVLKVLYRLKNSDQMAYLVGGAVRDLLLGRKPKDYDVATDARPDQIRKLFVNSRLIGRRFRLAHIVFRGGKVIELSTFRKSPDPPGGEENGEEGEERDILIHEDNTWGTPQQDAYRRDFTINALFYNVADFSVIDYVGGIADLKDGIIRTIGDPNIRFREDPVRMIRAVEYAARLDFEMTPEVLKGIRKHRKDLRKASVARMSDEMLSLLRSGAAEKAFRKLHDTGLLEILHPDLHRSLEGSPDNQLFRQLALIDQWVTRGRAVNDTVLFGSLTLEPMAQAAKAAEERKGGRLAKGEYLSMVEDLLKDTNALIRIPVKRQHQLKQAFLGAYKMRRRPSDQRDGQSMAGRGYFRDALDLFTLEVEITDQYRNVLKDWQQLKGGGGSDGRRGGSRRGSGDSRDRGRRDDGRRRKPESDSRQRDEGEKQEHRPDRKPDDRPRKERDTRSRDGQRKPREQDRKPREEGRKPREEERKPRDEDRTQPDMAPPVDTTPPPVEQEPVTPPVDTTPPPVEQEPVTPPVDTTPPPVEQEPATPTVEMYSPEEVEHGREKREKRSWQGVAGQQSPVIQKMKERIDNGEMSVHSDGEAPWYTPGQPLDSTGPNGGEEAGNEEGEEEKSGNGDPDAGKWGRAIRHTPPEI
ncbi:polynucleotide adenylyltransferase PcnB [Gemmatimonadota bacterium]